ncbi:MAG: hypothetical protein GTN80_01690 [Nitrososphaeria archaeon]|nr:hypothetical protein [Nitrososphaeria archaeon]NIN51816.1 hypothetical protein [Nitrososphaeria archaeon]NIQ32351.1 hypothetical protein [Nitrososphaeria archaeon]
MVSLGANGFARIVLGLDVKDVTAGFKAYGAEAARFLVNTKIRGKSFEYQPESLFRLSRAGFKITEIPFTFRDREVGKSKFKLRDIFSFSWKIMMIRFRS